MNELALFAGAGGGLLGSMLFGPTRPVCAVEIDPYRRSVLFARQRDGIFPPFPVWDDVCTFDGRPWRGHVDLVSGGFPCQDISAAGTGAGITGARSGLWVEMARVIREVAPGHVFVENSPLLTRRGLSVVLGDLASMGFDARWGVLGAGDAGAPHIRKRIWIVATANGWDRKGAIPDADGNALREQPERGEGGARPAQPRQGVAGNDGAHGELADADEGGQPALGESLHRSQQGAHGGEPDRCGVQALGNSDGAGLAQQLQQQQPQPEQPAVERPGWWGAEPDVGRVADGVAHRVDRLAALGDGQVPAVAALAWAVLRR